MIGVEGRIGFGPRFVAAFIDGVIVIVLAIVLGLVAGGFLGALVGAGAGAAAGAAAGAGAGMFAAMAGFMVAMTLVGVLYPLIEGLKGWSPGKRLTGLLIGTADGELAPPKVLMTRYAIKNSANLLGFAGTITGIALLTGVSSLLAVVVTIGCLMVLMAPRQALHDRIAGTAVFKAAALREMAAMQAVRDAMPDADETSDAAQPESAVATETEEPAEERPAAPRPVSRPVAPPPPSPRPTPRPATAAEPGQQRQCPKCGQYDTVLGAVIGWYCRICGWRESRG